MDISNPIVQWAVKLIVGAIGGNAAGALLQKFSLGTLWNTVVGLVGGGIGGELLQKFAGDALGGGVVNQVAGAGVGGSVLLVVVGMIKQMMGNKP